MSNLSTPEPANQITEDLTQLKIETDRVKRAVHEKKQQIHFLELEASKLDELKILIRDAMIIMSQKEGIQFFEDVKNPENMPFLNPAEYVDAMKKAISKVVEKHSLLSKKFEQTLKNEKTKQEREVESAEKLLQQEKDKLDLVKEERDHKMRLVEMLKGQKVMLQRTIMMYQDAVERHRMQHNETEQSCEEKIKKHTDVLNKLKEKTSQIDVEHEKNLKAIEIKKKAAEEMLQNHETLVAQKENIKQELKKLAHDENCLMSDLDKAKEKLEIIKETNDSYLANLKTHELLNAERENERLRNLLKNEKKRSSANLEAQIQRTKQLEASLEKIVIQTRDINQQISDSEQRMQTISMRIPDFNQLEQALDKVIQNAQKSKAEALQTQYMLDEIRDKNRLIEQQEYNESKARTELLLQKLAEPKIDDN